MTYVIAQPCVDVLDKACVDECPVDCIYEGERMLYIHPDECVDCGACEPVCPVEAIFYEDDTPEQWKDFYKANVEFFDDLGSPGGAAKIGKIEKDHPHRGCPPATGSRELSPAPRSPPGSPTSPGTGSRTHKAARRRAPRRDRRPVGRHTGRPGPGGRAAGARPTPRTRPATRPCTAPRRSGGRRRLDGAPARRDRAASVDAVLPAIGTKELVASLPMLLGLGPGSRVMVPELAYPTYEIGARVVGAEVLATDSTTAVGPGPRRPGVGELARQPDRSRAAGRAPAQDGHLGPRAGRRARLRRVLRRARAGTRNRCRCCTRTSAAARTTASWRCTRCRSGRTWPATGPASWPVTPRWCATLLEVRKHLGLHDADPGAGGDDGCARRRRARRRAAGALRRDAGSCCSRRCARPGSPSSTPRPGSTCG